MMGLGVTELVIILVIIIVLFGASRLPQIGRGLGEGISNFKKSVHQIPILSAAVVMFFTPRTPLL